jgi:hypothetical protein
MKLAFPQESAVRLCCVATKNAHVHEPYVLFQTKWWPLCQVKCFHTLYKMERQGCCAKHNRPDRFVPALELQARNGARTVFLHTPASKYKPAVVNIQRWHERRKIWKRYVFILLDNLFCREITMEILSYL